MYDSGIDACRQDLYTDEQTLRQKYPEHIADKVLRIREMHQWMISNPSSKDAVFISEVISRFGVSKPTAYSDLKVIKALLPLLSESSKEFNRWRFNEMILRTFEVAELRKDARTMERAAATFAKYNRVDVEDVMEIPVDQIVPQPFMATDDPSVLGIKQLPNIRERQRKLLDKYIKEVPDIEDIQAEEPDLEEKELFDDPFTEEESIIPPIP